MEGAAGHDPAALWMRWVCAERRALCRLFGGTTTSLFGVHTKTMSCEVLSLDGGVERWESLPHMHDARIGMECAAIGGCVIVAGGCDEGTVEVYEEALGRWRSSVQPSRRRQCRRDEQRADVMMRQTLKYIPR